MVEGRAVAAGDDVGPSSSVPPVPVAAFDPCALDVHFLQLGVRVDPTTQQQRSDGCQWHGDGFDFVSALANDISVDAISTTPGVTGLEQFDVTGSAVSMFVFDGSSCVSLFAVGADLVQFTMVETTFDPICFELEVATRLILTLR